jgi:hypothetical protein
MVYKEIEFGTSARITIRGDDEKITVSLIRSGERDWKTTIRKHPGVLESIFPQYIPKNGMAPLLANEKQKEQIFRDRIKECYKIKTDMAYWYVNQDEELIRKCEEKKKAEEQRAMEIGKFIDSIAPEVKHE